VRALRYHGNRDVRIDDIPEPEVRPGTVKLQVHWCGICGSDLHEYLGGPLFSPHTDPHPLVGETNPVVMGHEFAGEIVEVGEGVEGLAVGQRVAVQPTITDGTCPDCLAGNPQVCKQIGFHGLSGGGGGLSEFTVVPASMAKLLPESVPSDLGALVEPIAVSFHGIRHAGVQTGDTVLVLGAGPIGLTALLCLKAAGASLVVVSEVAESRKKLAEQLGAHAVLDPTVDDLAARTEELTGGRGFDVTIDAAGVQATFDAAVSLVRPHGTVLNLAVWERPIEFNPNSLVFNEATLTASLCYADGDFERVIKLLAEGRLEPQALITRRIKLADAVTEGFEELVARKDDHVKILVQP
jgi:(R,R)-butanediol dehydrogenase / meso-butanediol dehydrogenase / diacetyl reductase